MISKISAKLIAILPKSFTQRFAKYILNRYVSKYSKITIINGERLEKIKTPVIFISNHLSNSDGLVLNRVLGDGKVWFLAGVKLSQNAITRLGVSIIKTVPISPNSPDRSAISTVIKLLKSGQSVCIFPEGTRSRESSMIKGKKGVLLIQKLTNLPMVPIGIEGTEKLLPINDEDMGGESFNYADVKITIGESFYLPEIEDKEDKREYEERALHFTMGKIAVLLSSKYQGIYRE